MKKFLTLIVVLLSTHTAFADPTLTHFGSGKKRMQTSGVFLTEDQILPLRPAAEEQVRADAMALVQAENHPDTVEGQRAAQNSLRAHLRRLSDPILAQQLAAHMQTLWCFRVVGDGDCGFYALETTRDEVMTQVKADLENADKRDYVLAMLQYEAASYFLAADDFAYGLQLQNNFTKSDAERFLNARYDKPKNTPNGYQYYLDVVPMDGGTGLINLIAKYKNFNVNVWKWKEGQKPKKGVKLVKTIRVNGAVRTVDIVEGDRHFSRLVNANEDLPSFAENSTNAIEHEKEWERVVATQRVQKNDDAALAHALALSMNGVAAQSSSNSGVTADNSSKKKADNDEDDDDYKIRFPGAGRRLNETGGAAGAENNGEVKLSADERLILDNIAAAFVVATDEQGDKKDEKAADKPLNQYVEGTSTKKWDMAQSFTPGDFKDWGIETNKSRFSPTSFSDVCVTRIALPKSSADATYSVGFGAALGGRFTYLLVRDEQLKALPFKLGAEDIMNGTHLKEGNSMGEHFGVTVAVPAHTQAFIFMMSPWTGGNGNILETTPAITRIS